MDNKTNNYEVLLFDVTDVLVEPSSKVRNTILSWRNMSNQELGEYWIQSPAARAFDQGKISSHTYAKLVVQELDIPVRPLEFLELYRNWPQRLYEGIPELLSTLGSQCRLACFSNTNEAHWPRIQEKFNLSALIGERFLSYEIGLLKPDKDAFEFVVQALDCPAEKIAFFDHNQLTIDVAKTHVMHAFHSTGRDQLQSILGALEILESSNLPAGVGIE